MTEIETDKKIIADMIIKFNRINDYKNSEYIILEISINEPLREFLLKNLVSDKECLDYSNQTTTRKRYKQYSYIHRALINNGASSYFLSDKHLLDFGKTSLMFSTISDCIAFMGYLKENLLMVYRNVNELKNLNVSMVFKQ